ncbi:MAG: hypothetical protein IJA18_03035, partial [Ruminococcus sp.]|nr:hypothetical protein [Ruminococcus sp.]
TETYVHTYGKWTSTEDGSDALSVCCDFSIADISCLVVGRMLARCWQENNKLQLVNRSLLYFIIIKAAEWITQRHWN